MAITIDYSDDVTPQYVIQIPKTDMLDVTGGSPTEIRQLNIDTFRRDLDDLMDDTIGIVFPTTHEHTPPLTVAGVTLARVLEILDPYVIEFEDDQYNVNIVGGNSNVSDKVVKNQVGVNTANSAGLQDPFALQFSAFLGEVAVMANSGFSGTTFPLGTRSFPVDNLADALTIAIDRGIRSIRIIGNLTIDIENFSIGFMFIGDSPETTTITIDASANVTNCEFRNAEIQGTLDNDNILRKCSILDLDMFSGSIEECGLGGTITIGTGTQAQIINCHSDVAGGGAGQYPTIDCGGSVATDIVVRDFQGGIGFENLTAAIDVSIDMSSGRVILENTITAGNITVRGVADLEDNSGGTATISDLTINKDIRDIHKIHGLKSGTDLVITDTTRDAGDISQTIDDDGTTTTVSRP